jgi:hypothetical protein
MIATFPPAMLRCLANDTRDGVPAPDVCTPPTRAENLLRGEATSSEHQGSRARVVANWPIAEDGPRGTLALRAVWYRGKGERP